MLIVIEGVVTPNKQKFRPSDWAEMLMEGVGWPYPLWSKP